MGDWFSNGGKPSDERGKFHTASEETGKVESTFVGVVGTGGEKEEGKKGGQIGRRSRHNFVEARLQKKKKMFGWYRGTGLGAARGEKQGFQP